MNGIEYIADTNAILYLLSGKECMRPYLNKRMVVSVIIYMELLSFSGISEREETVIRSVMSDCVILGINTAVRELTIQLRRRYRIKLPDAIIAATALSYDANLVTADNGFEKITELKLDKLIP